MMMILFNSRASLNEEQIIEPAAEKDMFWVTQGSPAVTPENFHRQLQTQMEMEKRAAKVLSEPHNHYTEVRYKRLPDGKSGAIFFN